MITEVLAEAGVDRRELTAVVVGTGPAPFTGLRVGLVTARTLALALGIPVLGVPSLDALAVQASPTSLPAGTEVLVATDARRREVYWALYRLVERRARSRRSAGPEVAAAADVAADRRAPPAPSSSAAGTVLYPDVLRGGPRRRAARPRPRGARAAGADPAAAGRGRCRTEPLYLRRPDAGAAAARKRVLG